MPSGCALILTSFISTTTSDSAGTEPRISPFLIRKCSDDIVAAGAWLNFSFLVHCPRFGSIQLIAQTLARQH